MLKRNKKITILLGLLLSATLSSVKPTNVLAASNRLSGQDRYETAVAISKQGWENSDYVVIASGEGYADALCAAPLAKRYNAPILLTQSSSLNSETKNEIKRLKAKHVFIIGKYASISQSAESELQSVVGNIKRLGGNDRYETSVIVAKELGNVDKVVVTSGYGFADALSVAPIAAQENMPILLTGKDQLPAVIQSYINENKASIKNSYIIGGQGVISDTAANQVSSTAVRLSGSDRFETSFNVMKYFKDKLKFDNIYVVQADGPTGNEFADALSGAALAVKTSAPVVLTYKTVSSDIENFIKTNAGTNTSIIALGGAVAVPEALISQLTQAISSEINNTENTGNVQQGGGTPSGGGGASSGGGTSSNNTSSNQELTSLVNKLNSIKSDLGTENEKTIVSSIIDSINKVIANPSYDVKNDASQVKAMYENLSPEEQSDLQNKILSTNLTISQILQLKAQFDL